MLKIPFTEKNVVSFIDFRIWCTVYTLVVIEEDVEEATDAVFNIGNKGKKRPCFLSWGIRELLQIFVKFSTHKPWGAGKMKLKGVSPCVVGKIKLKVFSPWGVWKIKLKSSNFLSSLFQSLSLSLCLRSCFWLRTE